ncbi:MAG: A/G-specific adenine glycosylase [Luteolibacter sp.]
MLKPRCQINALRAKDAFHGALVDWFSRNAKDYPWRRTTNPYEILVSEVMLQQTQIATVLGRGFYHRFLEVFPDVETLAEAGDEPLLKAWEGLGYYRRARMLRDTARAVISRHDGRFPTEPEVLQELPGIGRYTVGALRAFAFGLPAVLVDGNVARVLSRLFDEKNAVDDGPGLKRIWRLAEELADHARPRAYHAALMELGQTICRPGVPDCLSCPVSGFCETREPEKLPVKKPKTTITEVDEHAVWILDAQGRLLLHRESGKRRQGLWKLPTRSAEEIGELPVLAELRYTITRYRVTLKVHDGGDVPHSFSKQEDEWWISLDEVLGLAMPAPFRRVIVRLFEEL